jgi:hypothetical protein
MSFTKKPYWLSAVDPNTNLNDKICDLQLYRQNEVTDIQFSLDICMFVNFDENSIIQNDDGTWHCDSEKRINELSNIYVKLYAPNLPSRRIWIDNKVLHKNDSLQELGWRLFEEQRRKYFPKYLYLISDTEDISNHKISDFILYSKSKIPENGLHTIRVLQTDIPSLYKSKDGNYECIDKEIRFGDNNKVPFTTVKKQLVWHKPDHKPDAETCKQWKNKFLGWNGTEHYIAVYNPDMQSFVKDYDEQTADDQLMAWTCLTAPPDKDYWTTQ